MKRYILYYCPIILLAVSCGENSLNKELQEFIGSEITVPDDMILLNSSQNLSEFIDKEQKLIFYMDSLLLFLGRGRESQADTDEDIQAG